MERPVYGLSGDLQDNPSIPLINRMVHCPTTDVVYVLPLPGERHFKSEYLFYSSRGDKLERSANQKTFKKWAEKAGLSESYSIHSLRHTHATRLYKASGNNLRMIQKQLGHSNIQTTTVYSDILNEAVDKALKNMEES